MLNPENINDFCSQLSSIYQNNVDVSHLPLGLSYLLILGITGQMAQKSQHQHIKPQILTFMNQDVTIKQLKKQYKLKEFKNSKKNFYFTFQSGRKVIESYTIKQLKARLKRKSLNGLLLFTKLKMHKLLNNAESQSDDDFQNQAFNKFLADQTQTGFKDYFSLKIQVNHQNRKQYFKIQILSQKNGNHLIDRILFQLQKQFDLKLKPQNIRCKIKQKNLELQPAKSLIGHNLNDDCTIIVEFKDKNTKLVRPGAAKSNKFITIYGLCDEYKKQFNFYQIQNKQFQLLYQQQLKQGSVISQLKHDSIICLKVLDVIIKPKQKLSILSKIFQNQGIKKATIVGKIVHYSQIFQYHMNQLKKNKIKFNLDQVNIPERYMQTRKKYQKQIQRRSQTTQIIHFQRYQNVLPLYIYTTQLKCLQKGQIVPKSIYKAVNQNLNKNPLLSLNQEDVLKQWKHKFCSSLLLNLRKLPIHVGKVYRGVSYNPRFIKGHITTFAQFLSTSIDQNVATKNFMKQCDSQYYLFQMIIKKGYSISQFSAYKYQQQVLIQPLTSFQITDIKQEFKNNKKVNRYYLKQVDLFPRQIPKLTGHFIIWIDDKSQQGLSIYQGLNLQDNTSVLIQLGSTSQLQLWLNKYNPYFSQQTANIVLITNMTRKEGLNINQYAGIDGLQLIRKYRHSKDIPICFYIGNQELCMKKLKQRNIEPKNIIITKYKKNIQQFIIENINKK